MLNGAEVCSAKNFFQGKSVEMVVEWEIKLNGGLYIAMFDYRGVFFKAAPQTKNGKGDMYDDFTRCLPNSIVLGGYHAD